jgi:hypothetical protein
MALSPAPGNKPKDLETSSLPVAGMVSLCPFDPNPSKEQNSRWLEQTGRNSSPLRIFARPRLDAILTATWSNHYQHVMSCVCSPLIFEHYM